MVKTLAVKKKYISQNTNFFLKMNMKMMKMKREYG